MTHCNVIALLSESCNPLDGIFKHGSMVLKAIDALAKNSHFSVNGSNYVEFLQNILVSLMNVIYLIPSIKKGLRPSLKNYSLMLLFCKND